MMQKLSVLFIGSLLLVVFGCAQGELEGQENDGVNQNASANDNGGGDNGGGDNGGGDNGNGDNGGGDNGDGDNGDGDNGDLCADVNCEDDICDPATGDCVECIQDLDCDDGVCDEPVMECVECTDDTECADELTCDIDGQTCVGCIDDSDCAGDAKCHDVYPTCVDACCTFVRNDVFTDISYSHDRFDIAVTPDGEPTIVFIDSDDVRYAERINDNWYTQDVGPISQTTGSHIRHDLDSQGNPHIVVRRYNEWKYYWRDGSTWNEADVWDAELGSGSTGIAVDSDDIAHFFGVGGYNDDHQLYYATYDAQNGWDRQGFEIDDELHLGLPVLDLDSDDEPVLSFSIFDDGYEIYLARKQSTGWVTELVVTDVGFSHHMAIGADDEVMIVHFGQDLPHTGLELSRNGSGSWVTETVNSYDEATTPYVAIDDRNDPHIVFRFPGSGDFENYLGYTRWDGADWETHDVDDSLVERSFWQRIAVDDEYAPHIAVYDSDRDTISYVTVD